MIAAHEISGDLHALTVHQPYAHLIAEGQKLIENREWYLPAGFRFPLTLAIHAGKSLDWFNVDEDGRDMESGLKPDEHVFGAIVCIVRVRACLPTMRQGHALSAEAWPERYRSLRHNRHANGPVCWMLDDVHKLATPVPHRGYQKLWLVHTMEIAQIVRQLED